MRPVLGAISPASWQISVVLPAPFGPMMACSSPAVTSSVTLSEATTPPKRLVRPSIRSSASATAVILQDAVDAAAREQHNAEQHRAKNDPRILGDARKHLLQQQERDRANHR